jgi:hypothetical protein
MGSLFKGPDIPPPKPEAEAPDTEANIRAQRLKIAKEAADPTIASRLSNEMGATASSNRAYKPATVRTGVDAGNSIVTGSA